MHSPSTLFPDDIDPRTFYSDVQLQHASIHNGYNELVATGNYQEASEFLHQNVEEADVNMDYNGSYLWNKFDTAIRAIEEYVIADTDSTTRGYYGRSEPTETWDNMIWIAY